MSADAVTTCPNCLERELREYHDLFCRDERGLIVADTEDPPVRPVTYHADITLECRVCDYRAELFMSTPLIIGLKS